MTTIFPGLSDALSLALIAQADLIQYADGLIEWSQVLESVAVFVASAQRGEQVPLLARMILEGGGGALDGKLRRLRECLEGMSLGHALPIAAAAHRTVGLPSKAKAWEQAAGLLRPMAARALRANGSRSAVAMVAHDAARASTGLMTEVADSPGEVQLMNLHQTKGREADATVVVLRASDFFGSSEQPPYVNTSRLLYVVFSRARHRVVLLLIGEGHRPQIAPLARLAALGRAGVGS